MIFPSRSQYGSLTPFAPGNNFADWSGAGGSLFPNTSSMFRIADIRVSAEGKEGIQSFLDKRKPAWQNP